MHYLFTHKLSIGYNELDLDLISLQAGMYNILFQTENGDQYLKRIIKY